MTRLFSAAFAVFVVSIAVSTLMGQAPNGKTIFAKRCGGCHSLTADMEGPKLGGVYGRAAASGQTFSYSEALRNSKIVWGEATLDRWLTDPGKMVPGTDMEFHVESADERGAIIAYLRENSGRR